MAIGAGAGAEAGKSSADRFTARSVLLVKTVHDALSTRMPSQFLQTGYDSFGSRRWASSTHKGFAVTFEASYAILQDAAMPHTPGSRVPLVASKCCRRSTVQLDRMLVTSAERELGLRIPRPAARERRLRKGAREHEEFATVEIARSSTSLTIGSTGAELGSKDGRSWVVG